MNLNALRYFYEASHYETLTKASQALHISQPALTKHIKNIEKEYGTQLVKKNGRHIVLTDFGKELINECTPLFQQEKKIERLLMNQSQKHVLRIGSTQLNSQDVIKSILTPDSSQHVNLQLTTDNTKQIQELLLNHQLDMAILPNSSYLKEIKKEFLFEDELIFVAKPNYCNENLSLKDVLSHQFIQRESGSSLQQLLNSCFSFEVSYSVEVTSHADALLACEYGNGIYLCSKISAQQSINTNKLKQISIETIQFDPRPFYLYYHEKLPTNQFIIQIIQQFKQKTETD
ncbi:LysR family transcriptional regulator [Vagococcus sp.]|uniref:LysR family transcriptional regulator n=1 Tax=Vagococcus sp. TaxID=1933889 RepID=UPI002FC97769